MWTGLIRVPLGRCRRQFSTDALEEAAASRGLLRHPRMGARRGIRRTRVGTAAAMGHDTSALVATSTDALVDAAIALIFVLELPRSTAIPDGDNASYVS